MICLVLYNIFKNITEQQALYRRLWCMMYLEGVDRQLSVMVLYRCYTGGRRLRRGRVRLRRQIVVGHRIL